ncbi:MAG TPA: hypothetical protein VGK99_18555 [Acidobacteriota bacterium]|jgi:cell division protein FtsL
MKDYHCQQIQNRAVASAAHKISLSEIGRYVLLGSIVAFLILAYSWFHSEIIALGYQVQEIKRDTALLKEQHQALLLEHAACRSPQRIDAFARAQLGLIPANSEKVVFISDSAAVTTERVLAESILPAVSGNKETRQ